MRKRPQSQGAKSRGGIGESRDNGRALRPHIGNENKGRRQSAENGARGVSGRKGDPRWFRFRYRAASAPARELAAFLP